MPIDTPQRAVFDARNVALVHVQVRRDGIQPAMHAAIHELSSLLQAQGIPPAGPWFAHHHRRPTDTFDFDVCFPVAKEIQPGGRIVYAHIPATEVVRTIYRGPYEGLPTAWPEFVTWIGSNGYKTREDAFEVYVAGPREDPDPAHWQTELNYPLLGDSTPAQQGGL